MAFPPCAGLLIPIRAKDSARTRNLLAANRMLGAGPLRRQIINPGEHAPKQHPQHLAGGIVALAFDIAWARCEGAPSSQAGDEVKAAQAV